MPSAAVARLESLLSARKLDHTLTSHHPASRGMPGGVVATGLAEVDASLGGGLPRGQISEVVGARSTGRQTLLVSCLAAATSGPEAELVALVDSLDMFDPSSAVAGGVDVSRVLWVRGHEMGRERVSVPRQMGDLRFQVDRAVKAVNLVLQAGGFGLVVLDLAEIPAPVVTRLPFTTWRRLHHVIEGSETACLVVAGQPLARSAGGITLALDPVLPPSHHVRDVRMLPVPEFSGRAVQARGLKSTPIQLHA